LSGHGGRQTGFVTAALPDGVCGDRDDVEANILNTALSGLFSRLCTEAKECPTVVDRPDGGPDSGPMMLLQEKAGVRFFLQSSYQRTSRWMKRERG